MCDELRRLVLPGSVKVRVEVTLIATTTSTTRTRRAARRIAIVAMSGLDISWPIDGRRAEIDEHETHGVHVDEQILRQIPGEQRPCRTGRY